MEVCGLTRVIQEPDKWVGAGGGEGITVCIDYSKVLDSMCTRIDQRNASGFGMDSHDRDNPEP